MTHHSQPLVASPKISSRVRVPSLLPKLKAISPKQSNATSRPAHQPGHRDYLSTDYLEPTMNSLNLHQFNQDCPSPLPSAHFRGSQQIMKKPPVSHIQHHNYYDEYIDTRHVVARYKLSKTSASELSSTSISASPPLNTAQHSLLPFVKAIGDFFLWLYSIMAKKFHCLLFGNPGQILPSHREPSLPQLYKLVIPISGCSLEIEGRVAHSDKLKDVHYQIYSRPDFPANEIEADIIYLPEVPLNGPMDVSPLMSSFINGGYRIIIPQVNGLIKTSRSGAQSIPDVGNQSRVIATVLRHLRYQDMESEKSFRTGAAKLELDMIEAETSKISSTSSLGRPIFLLGLGHAALVALSYPLEIGQPIHDFPPSTGSSGALSIPSVSARAEPAGSLMGKINSFCDSVNSGMTGLGWWAQGSAKQARAESKVSGPLPNIHGIIAIGPMLDPNGSSHKRNSWIYKTKVTQSPGVGPANYSPSISNAVKRLHLNASNIRVPVMIVHGTKEAFNLVEGTNSFYGALASMESTLVFCPTLRHSGDLAGDSARNGLVLDCMKWIGERTVQKIDLPPDASTDTLRLPLPIKTSDFKPINQNASTNMEVASGTTSQSSLMVADLEEVDCSSDFGTWFGSESDSGRTYSRNSYGGESIRSFTTQSVRLSAGSLLYSPELLGSMSIEIQLDCQRTPKFNSPHLSSGFPSPTLRTPATDFFPFLPFSAKIIEHGPRDVVAVLRSNRDSYQSLSCVNIPGSSLGFN